MFFDDSSHTKDQNRINLISFTYKETDQMLINVKYSVVIDS